MRPSLAGLTLAAALTAAPAAGAQTKGPKEQAIGALTTFAVAYAAWLYDGRCHELDAGKHAEFQRLIEADLLRLNEVFEPRLVGAATGSGQGHRQGPGLRRQERWAGGVWVGAGGGRGGEAEGFAGRVQDHGDAVGDEASGRDSDRHFL